VSDREGGKLIGHSWTCPGTFLSSRFSRCPLGVVLGGSLQKLWVGPQAELSAVYRGVKVVKSEMNPSRWRFIIHPPRGGP